MLPLLFIITGACAALMQALFFRELLAVFQGNDLVAGMLLAHLAFAFSCGFFAFSKIKTKKADSNAAMLSFFAAAVFFFFSFMFIMNIRSFLNIPLGGGISLKSSFFCIFAAVFPAFFSYAMAAAASMRINKESIPQKHSVLLLLLGASAGGFAFYLFLYSFEGTNIVLLSAVLLCAAAMLCAGTEKKAKMFFAAALVPVFLGIFFDIREIDRKILENNFSPAEIVEYGYTSYGQAAMVRKNNEYSLLVNNILFFAYPDNDILNSEDFGHIPVLHPEYPDNVLIIGGAAKYLPMILEHNVKRVDYIEPDEAVVKIVRGNIAHLGYAFNDDRVFIHNEKVRKFLNSSNVKYNLILVGLPAPVNLKLNSCYTKEFFLAAKENMQSNGFIAVRLPGTMAFSTYIMAELNKSVMDAMKSAFRHTNIIPGSQNILIASDRAMPYRLHIKKRLYKMQETTLVLSKYYLDDRMDTERTRWLKNEMDKIDEDDLLLNSDWNPSAMLLSVLHSQSAFSPYLSLAADKARKYVYFILFAVIIIFFLSKSVYTASGFVAGAASAWLFISILFTVQILNGEAYRFFGYLSSVFFLGILSGLAYSMRTKSAVPLNKRMFYAELLFVLLIILLFCVFKFYSMNMHIIRVFLLLTGFAAGVEFEQLITISDLFREKGAGKIKIFLSAAFGIMFSALAGGSFLIVAWGMEKSLLFILFMKFLIFCRWADLNRRGL